MEGQSAQMHCAVTTGCGDALDADVWEEAKRSYFTWSWARFGMNIVLISCKSSVWFLCWRKRECFYIHWKTRQVASFCVLQKKNRRWSDHGDDDSRCRIQCFLSIQTCTQFKVVCDTPMLSQNTQKHPKLRGELPVDLFLRRCFFHQHFRSNHKFQRYFSWAKSSHPGWIV